MRTTRRRLLTSAGIAVTLAGCLEGDDTDDTTTEDDTADDEVIDDDSTDSEQVAGGTDDETDEAAEEDDNDDVAATVEVVSNAFEPAFLTVDPGATVEWELQGGSHTVTLYHEDSETQHRAPEEAAAFDADLDTSFTHTFNQEGTYDYFCRPHEGGGMVGTVVVGDPDEDDHGLAVPADDLPSSARDELGALNEQTREEFNLDPVEENGAAADGDGTDYGY